MKFTYFVRMKTVYVILYTVQKFKNYGCVFKNWKTFRY